MLGRPHPGRAGVVGGGRLVVLDETSGFVVEDTAERPSGVPGTGNRLLAALPAEIRQSLVPHARVVTHSQGSALFEPDHHPDTVVFPAVGTVVSLLVPLWDAKPVESAVVGAEGAVGAILGPSAGPSGVRSVVLVGGRALHLPAEVLFAALASSPTAAAVMARYAASLLGHLHQAVACAALHPVEARASRWILALHDRLGERAAVPMTQEILADRLGVRRTTVTRVIATLEGKGVIQHRRGRVHVLDRSGLERTSCGCYATQRARMECVAPGLYPPMNQTAAA
jgi:CRP-like cAMP-binding protein